MVTPAGCYVGGPSIRLEQLINKSIFFQSATLRTNLSYKGRGSALIYGETEIRDIMGPDGANLRPTYPPCWPFLSPIDGKEIAASGAPELFRRAVECMLQRPVRVSALMESAIQRANEMKEFKGRILIPGSADSANTFAFALASGLQIRTEVVPLTLWCDDVLREKAKGSDTKSKIAIVGMSARFSPILSTEELGWDADTEACNYIDGLERKLNGAKLNGLSRDRLDHELYVKGPFARCNNDSDLLDPRLAIVTAYEALEMAGFVPNRTPSSQLDRVGAFYSQTSDDWQEFRSTKGVKGPVPPRAFTPGRVSHYFNFGGPCHSVDTACTSSLAAVHRACRALQSDECDTAVVGGLDVSSGPKGNADGESLSRVQSPEIDGPSKVENEDGDNEIAQAKGVGTIVLKRSEDAGADKDNILGFILQSATNHSGDGISVRHPYAGSQTNLHSRLLRMAGIDPSEVSYISKQGTVITSPEDAYVQKGTNEVTSGKIEIPQDINSSGTTMNAQIEGAFGVTALISLILKMRKQETLDEATIRELDQTRGLPTAKVSSLVNRKPRLAFLTRVSLARGNTALLLQGQARSIVTLSPQEEELTIDLQFLVVVSANTPESLQLSLQSLQRHIQRTRQLPLTNAAYTTTARRVHHRYRCGFPVTSKDDLLTQVTSTMESFAITAPNHIPTPPPKVAFIFTGQGAFYPQLASQLYRLCSRFRTDITYLADLATHQGLPSFMPAITGTADEGCKLPPQTQQLALACVQMALVRLWRAWGVVPTAVVGQSLGEYAALNAAGVISVDHTIHLVGQRGRILQASCDRGTHGMLAVQAGVDTINSISSSSSSNSSDSADDKAFEVECLNSPTDSVIGGTKSAMVNLASALKSAGIRCAPVDLPYAFHSAQVEPVLEPYRYVAEGVVYEPPCVPVISSLLGKVIAKGGVFDAEYCERHTRDPVNLVGAVRAAAQRGIIDVADTICVEIGPHPVCSRFVASSLGAARGAMKLVPSLRRNEAPWKTLCTSLGLLHCAGVEVDWAEVHRDADTRRNGGEGARLVPGWPGNRFGVEDCEEGSYPITSLPVPPFLGTDLDGEEQ